MRGLSLCLFFFFCLLTAFPLLAQDKVSLIGGFNLSGIYDKAILAEESPLLASQFGVGVHQPLQIKRLDSLYWEISALFNQLGYHQDLDRNYSVRLNYLVVRILAGYRLLEEMELQAGLAGGMVFSGSLYRFGYGNPYNNFNLFLEGGATFLPVKKVSPYLYYGVGLLPILDYYTFDPLGNVVGDTRAMKVWYVSAGLKFNI